MENQETLTDICEELRSGECAILPLVLKRRWFDMIASGKKREEYRDATWYWQTRIHNWCDKQGTRVVEFRHGYGTNAPRMWFIVGDVFYRSRAHTYTWGEPESDHYAIALGERVTLTEGGK